MPGFIVTSGVLSCAGFPFGVFYVILPEVISVLAVFHTSRDPALWQARYRGRG
jgi:hypothetical protein